MRAVTQEQCMGCAVACVASILGISYKRALTLFKNKSGASTRGYYCREISDALQRGGKEYHYTQASHNKKLLTCQGAIVFIKRNKKYPAGHYLLRTPRGWMNPWVNFPDIKPAKAGFVKTLPGTAGYILFPIRN